MVIKSQTTLKWLFGKIYCVASRVLNSKFRRWMGGGWLVTRTCVRTSLARTLRKLWWSFFSPFPLKLPLMYIQSNDVHNRYRDSDKSSLWRCKVNSFARQWNSFYFNTNRLFLFLTALDRKTEFTAAYLLYSFKQDKITLYSLHTRDSVLALPGIGMYTCIDIDRDRFRYREVWFLTVSSVGHFFFSCYPILTTSFRSSFEANKTTTYIYMYIQRIVTIYHTHYYFFVFRNMYDTRRKCICLLVELINDGYKIYRLSSTKSTRERCVINFTH